ncbi:MAG: T9SS type A sorting domain-containing protein, partial [Paludibacter sp.]|nr:T9SS type A sorting domain-containing protein [Paludibacter sp.]
LQEDGKIIVSGWFSSYNGVPVSRIVRLNTDGSLDNSFNSRGTNGSVSAMALQKDGKVIIGGYFYTCDGVYINNLSRLQNNTVSAVNSLVEQEITVSPNPFSDEINIKTEWDCVSSRVEIINIKGQTVMNKDFVKEIILPANNLEPGVYIVKLRNAESVVCKKIVRK